MHNVKSNLLKAFSLILALLTLSGFLFSCEETTEYGENPDNLSTDIDYSNPGTLVGEVNIEVEDYVEKNGESLIRINSATPTYDEIAPAAFKSSISAEHITLSGMLEGKRVKSVTYVNSTAIDVLLDGNAKSFSKPKAIGTITISTKGLQNSYPSSCTVTVKKATIDLARSSSSSNINDNTHIYTYKATLTLSSGSFTENANSSHIRLTQPDPSTTAQITLSDNTLYIVVTYESDTASLSLSFDASTTSFNKSFTFNLKTDRSVVLE